MAVATFVGPSSAVSMMGSSELEKWARDVASRFRKFRWQPLRFLKTRCISVGRAHRNRLSIGEISRATPLFTSPPPLFTFPSLLPPGHRRDAAVLRKRRNLQGETGIEAQLIDAKMGSMPRGGRQQSAGSLQVWFIRPVLRGPPCLPLLSRLFPSCLPILLSLVSLLSSLLLLMRASVWIM